MTVLYKAEVTYVKRGEKQVRSLKLNKEWLSYDEIQKLVQAEVLRLRMKNDISRITFFEQTINVLTFDLEEDE